jgi:hypothetical protein
VAPHKNNITMVWQPRWFNVVGLGIAPGANTIHILKLNKLSFVLKIFQES